MQWLCDAGLAYKLEKTENIELPLSSVADATYFKLYASDIGLLGKKSGLVYDTLRSGDDLFVAFKGALAENYVLNELVSMGKEPFFWRSGNTAEVDFLIEEKGDVIPIEVKSADNVKAKSYAQFCKKYKPETGFKASLKNIAENVIDGTRTVNLPLYLMWNIENYLKRG